MHLVAFSYFSYWSSYKPIHEPGQISWGEGRGLRHFLGGGRGQNFMKIFLQICVNLEMSQKFSEKMAFFSQKSHKFLQKLPFFLNILLCKILDRGRVALNKNFIREEGIL
jgi:hypothetical protein